MFSVSMKNQWGPYYLLGSSRLFSGDAGLVACTSGYMSAPYSAPPPEGSGGPRCCCEDHWCSYLH